MARSVLPEVSSWLTHTAAAAPANPCPRAALRAVDFSITQKTFGFAKKQGLEFFFVSAADGTNVVKVFTEIIKKGWHYKHNSDDFVDQVNALLAEYRDDDEP